MYKIKVKKDLYELKNQIKEFNNKIVIIEKDFKWFDEKNNAMNYNIPVYNGDEFALQKYEIDEITKEGLVVWLPNKNRDFISKALINFDRLVGYIDDYGAGDLLVLCDFKNKSLFNKIWKI